MNHYYLRHFFAKLPFSSTKYVLKIPQDPARVMHKLLLEAEERYQEEVVNWLAAELESESVEVQQYAINLAKTSGATSRLLIDALRQSTLLP